MIRSCMLLTPDKRVNSNLAKDLVRGMNHNFNAITDSLKLKAKEKKVTETDKFLGKLKEMIEVMESGKEFGLYNDDEKESQDYDTVITPSKTEFSVTNELEKQKFIQMLETEKVNIKEKLTENLARDIEEILKMYDEKTSDEIEQLKLELFANLAAHPDQKESLLKNFKDQVSKIVKKNETDKDNALDSLITHVKLDIKNQLSALEQKYHSQIEEANITGAFISDLELDEFLADLLRKHRKSAIIFF